MLFQAPALFQVNHFMLMVTLLLLLSRMEVGTWEALFILEQCKQGRPSTVSCTAGRALHHAAPGARAREQRWLAPSKGTAYPFLTLPVVFP